MHSAGLGALFAALALGGAARAADLTPDPLHSPAWDTAQRTFFGHDPVRFDDRIRVRLPQIAENQHEFPVEVDARGVPGVKRMLVFMDLNPISLAIDFKPGLSQPFIATRIKLDRGTPVRGAVQLADGSWLVSGRWIEAAGGGCSAPPVSRARGDWAQHLGEVRGQAVAGADGARVRLVFRHPMDTGLSGNIPPFNLETVKLTGADGADYGEIEMLGSVGEDPAVTLITPAKVGEALTVAGLDTSADEYAAKLTVAAAHESAPVRTASLAAMSTWATR